MDALIFSLNSSLPIFLLMAVGWWIKRQGMLPPQTLKSMNSLAFNVAFPALLFSQMAVADIVHIFDPIFVAYAAIGTILIFTLTWLGAELCFKDKTSIGAFVQGSFRGNYAIVGLMLIASVLGDTGKGILLTAVVVPIYNIFSVAILTIRGKEIETGSVKRAAKQILRNPLLIGVLAGLPFALFKIPLFTSEHTKFIASSIQHLSALANPLAMIMLGASITKSGMSKNLGKAFLAVSIKLIISPLVFVSIAYLLRNALGFTGSDLLVLFVLFGVPTAVASYIMASNMNADAELAASILLLTSVFSMFTLTLGIYIFKAACLI
ncbi:MAG: AEC family transporter [Bacteroidales bacterium]